MFVTIHEMAGRATSAPGHGGGFNALLFGLPPTLLVLTRVRQHEPGLPLSVLT